MLGEISGPDCSSDNITNLLASREENKLRSSEGVVAAARTSLSRELENGPKWD
jgi:hypothetical protein